MTSVYETPEYLRGKPLSAYERAAVMQHAGGFTADQGAYALRRSRQSYVAVLKRAMRKLGVSGRFELIDALEAGALNV